MTDRQLIEKINEASDALIVEMRAARALFPSNRNLFPALVEEVGEVAKALLEEDPNWRQECLQVGCVALRLMREGDPSVFRNIGESVEHDDPFRTVVAFQRYLFKSHMHKPATRGDDEPWSLMELTFSLGGLVAKLSRVSVGGGSQEWCERLAGDAVMLSIVGDSNFPFTRS